MRTFPTLFQRTATGAIQQWTISAALGQRQQDGDRPGEIQTVWGQVDGAMQETIDIVRQGKNTGKANSTTAVQQAEKEAEAKWTKQKKKGYVEDIAQAQAGEVDAAVILGGIEPMLSPNRSYPKDDDLLKRIKFPCYYQPKLDGIRATGQRDEDGTSLWSRTRKPILSVPHIVKAVAERFLPGTRPDGELYSHEYRKTFEDLVSILKQDGPDAEGLHLRAEYHLYDLPAAGLTFAPAAPWSLKQDAPFSIRIEILYGLMFPDHDLVWTPGVVPGTEVLEHPADAPGPLFFVKTTRCYNMEQLLACFELDLAAEYEGGMAKNADAPYAPGKRSPNVQKMKLFEDHEFVVVGVNDGRGKDAGTAATFSIALPCLCHGLGTPGGEDSRARIKKPYAKRREYFLKAGELIGQVLTVTLKRWTAYGKPYLPVAKAFRDYE